MMKGVFILLTVVCTAFATPTCPKDNPKGDVLLSAEDCQHFYKCDHGHAYLMTCPPNEEWSQELQRCEWPEVAQCSQSSSNVPNPTSTDPTPKPTTPAYVSCPQENLVGEDVLLPAADCQHFYKCDHGTAYLIPCPKNQEWSQELKRCDWPEIAHCTPSSSNVTNPTPTPSEDTSPTPPTPKPTTPAYVNCPQENPIGEDVLLPAADCQHFYKCDHGVPYLIPCPNNQEWSQELKRCDWPEIAQCSTSSNVTNPTSSPSKSTPSATPTPTTPKPTPPPNVSCPPQNPEGEDVLLPAEDCKHFYKCDHGEPSLQECPENLEWSQELQRCDWPEVAQCTSTSNVTNPSPTSSTGTSEATTPTSKPTTPNIPDNVCPTNNGEFETFLAIPGVCDQFYKCDFGVPQIENCPLGTKFSHTMLRCDHPDVANCKEGVTGIKN